MTRQRESDDYAAGYADAMRDAAARSAKRAVDLHTRASMLTREAKSLLRRSEQLRDEAEAFHDAAQNVWAQWSDRRNWPDVMARVADARTGQAAASSKPTLALGDPEPPAAPALPAEEEMRRAAGQAWRA
ncbi:hypothetical protein ABID82_005253 [Methylobacterium sp. PvP062]|mgnify:CR=1 FL=1|uniref:Uncharacterized protein n=1 Tax=Methylobacterium radiotolerans TaxID=31998 RepID=A0ABV2NQ57_9HYPH|nr:MULTISPECIES: hypothetical protein [unclassified Methylobacterium]MBP2494622.1 hypothetical protein [Methylobacterium sp. PvP105]MBP2505507.1 hypothetical protein [Methylobacterium sp. PvP109]MCX7330095.1 hypothetical protein [Hyphomicrobiales bacterium]